MMKKTFLIGILISLFCVSVAFATSIYPANCTELKSLIEANCSESYELQKDINCTGEIGFTSICSGPPFFGVFDGMNHTITGLTISSVSHAGLFGGLWNSAVVKNIGLINVNMTAISQAGGIAGATQGSSVSVINCYVTGEVTGGGNVGGLIGNNYQGQITNCYATATVTGVNYVGGLTGGNSGSVNGSFATGTVTGTGTDIGGLIGTNVGGSVTNSYWDNLTSGQQNCTGSGSSTGCSGKTTADMMKKATFSGWDFDHIWGICEDATYPWLIWQDVDCGQGGGGNEGVIPEMSSNMLAIIGIIAIAAMLGFFMLKKN